MADFTIGALLDEGEVGAPRPRRHYTIGDLLDEGAVGAPRLRREWLPNSEVPFPTGPPSEVTVMPELAFELVEDDHEHICWLPLVLPAAKVRGSSTDPGAIALNLAKKDPAMADVGYHRMIRAWYRGNLVAKAMIEPRRDITHTTGTGSGEVATIGGRGGMARLEKVIVEPYELEWLPDMQTQRFNFAHPAFGSAGWGDAYIKAVQGFASPKWTGYPRGWSDPAAMWIAGSYGSASYARLGNIYGRRAYSLEDTEEFAAFWTGDNRAEVHFDGVEIGVGQNWQQLQRVDMTLSPGLHHIAFKLTNDPLPINAVDLRNPTAFLFTLRRVVQQGRLGEVVLRSNTTGWKILQYPTVEPGWTPGRILRYLLGLAAARGGPVIICNFTDTHDSAGQPFPIIPDLAVQVGSNMLQLIEQLSESYIDAEMAAGSWTLSVWNKGTAGTDTGIQFGTPAHVGDDDASLIHIDHHSMPPVATSLLLRYQTNWVRRSVTPPAGFPRVEAHVQIPQVQSVQMARDLGDRLLADFGRERIEYAAKIRPRNDGQVIPIAARQHDGIELPDRSSDMQPVNMLAWELTMDKDGKVFTAVEAGDLVTRDIERVEQWLQRMADGALAGVTAQALPSRPDTYDYTATTVPSTPMPFQRDADVVASESHPFPTDNFSIIIDAQARLGTDETVLGTDTDCEILVNGDVIGTVTIPAGKRKGTALGLAYSIDRDDDVTVRIVDTGFVVIVVVRFS